MPPDQADPGARPSADATKRPKAKKPKGLPPKLQAWVDARRRHHLSHAHVQMARELGLNPRKLGGLDNHRQEPWKVPLPQFIENIYAKRFGRDRPEVVMSIEDSVRQAERIKAQRQEAKRQEAQRQDAERQNSQPPATVEDNDE